MYLILSQSVVLERLNSFLGVDIVVKDVVKTKLSREDIHHHVSRVPPNRWD
jgi:hypothetical protein